MSRLIDADKLIEVIKQEIDMQYMYSPKGFINVVNSQPTAFDVNKVIRQLELLKKAELLKKEVLDDEEVENLCDCDDWYDAGLDEGRVIGSLDTYIKAIGIVKAGVIDG
jgi:hypothetical protein